MTDTVRLTLAVILAAVAQGQAPEEFAFEAAAVKRAAPVASVPLPASPDPKAPSLAAECEVVARTVVDETRPTGVYGFKLDFDQLPRQGAPVPTALGLKLEGWNVSFDMLVVDSMDREPTEN